jgi:hypothetical protein
VSLDCTVPPGRANKIKKGSKRMKNFILYQDDYVNLLDENKYHEKHINSINTNKVTGRN